MKSLVLPFLALASLLVLPAHAAEPKIATERFYGKATAVDHVQRNVTVHNARQKMDAVFQWDERTKLVSNKKTIPSSELKIGQSLIVSYVVDNSVNRARRITVRTPGKRAATR